MKVFIAGGTGAIGRPLIAELLAKGHDLVALTRSNDKAQALWKQGVEPVIADVFDADAVERVVRRARPEVVIEQLTALPRTYTQESMMAAAAFNHRIRLEGGANVLAAAQASGARRYLRQSIAFWGEPGPGLANEETPLATVVTPAVAADIRVVKEIERHLLECPTVEGIVLRYGFFYGPGTWFPARLPSCWATPIRRWPRDITSTRESPRGCPSCPQICWKGVRHDLSRRRFAAYQTLRRVVPMPGLRRSVRFPDRVDRAADGTC